MTIDKNKKILKKNKNEKKTNNTNNFIYKKEWIELCIPIISGEKIIGNTCINRINGSSRASGSLNNRIYAISMADLSGNENSAYKKLKLKHADVKNKLSLMKFYGLELTRDKLMSIVKRWQTLVETIVDIKTNEGCIFRIFIVAFSKKRKMQLKKTFYLNNAQIRGVRRKITEIIKKETNGSSFKLLVEKILLEKVTRNIEKKCKKICLLYNVFVSKVKVLGETAF